MTDLPTSATDQDRVELNFPNTTPYVTYALLGIIIACFGLIYLADLQITDPRREFNQVLQFGAMNYTSIREEGEWYRLFTGIFLHLGWAHIFFNAYSLYTLGRGLEAPYGHFRFGALYLLSGLFGSLVSFAIGRGASVGASGAIFGLFAAQLVFVYRHRELIVDAQGVMRQLGFFLLVNFGIGFLTAVAPGGVRIDNWGHIGGFVGGLIAAITFGPMLAPVITGNQAQLVDQTSLTSRVGAVVGLAIFEVIFFGIAMTVLPR
jgi:rhomboid protease GluP